MEQTLKELVYIRIHVDSQYKDGNICVIGCKTLSLQEWLKDDNYKKIGKKNNYNEMEIKAYYMNISMWAKELT
jgi:hypothetical protein